MVPVEQIRPKKRPKATARDLRLLQEMFPRHFGGLTMLPSSTGYGLREPRQPLGEPEMNYNAYFVVYAAPIPESEVYFEVLQRELREALAEGVILIERQEVWLM